jgi:hypothetical protein
MFYYDLIRFLHQRLASRSLASTYVYFYASPPRIKSNTIHRSNPYLIGHLAELDLVWGVPFLQSINQSTTNMPYQNSVTYTSEEIELSLRMIRYWSNFVKTGQSPSFDLSFYS